VVATALVLASIESVAALDVLLFMVDDVRWCSMVCEAFGEKNEIVDQFFTLFFIEKRSFSFTRRFAIWR
jgi:hypothetical protein